MQKWIKKIFGFGLASFLCDFGHEMTISLIPAVVLQFVGADQVPFFLGILSSLCDACASFLRIFAGYVSDASPHRKLIIMFGYGLSAVCTTLIGFAQSLWSVTFYRILSFAGSGIREPARDAIIATIVEPKHYGRAFGLRNAMDTLGSLFGPLLTFILIGIISTQQIFVVSFIPGILAVFAILFFTKNVAVVRKHTAVPLHFWNAWSRLPTSFLVLISILFIFDMSCFNKLLLLARAQEIIDIDTHCVTKVLVLLYALFNLVRACSEFLIGFLSDYLNRIILLALLGCGTFAVASFLLMAHQASFVYCCGFFSLIAISAAVMHTLKKSCAADMLPAEIRGLGYGVLQASQGFAALFSSALIGYLWTQFSAVLAFSYVIVMSLSAMILLVGFQLVYKK